MSFINKKTRLFKEGGDIEIVRKRSEGRLKTYISATDVRAWCANIEDRRQYILELILKETNSSKCTRIIPIEAIIDILLAEKNEQIQQLQSENYILKERCKEVTGAADNGDSKSKLKTPPSPPQPSTRPVPSAPPQPSTLAVKTLEKTAQTSSNQNLLTEAMRSLEHIEQIVEPTAERSRLSQTGQARDESRTEQADTLRRSDSQTSLPRRYSNLPDKVRTLKRQADETAELRQSVTGKDVELRKLYCHCKDTEINVENLKCKIKQLEDENCKLEIENKQKTCEIMCFGKIKKNYDDMVEKLKDFDQIKNERDKLKKELRDLKDAEEECDALRKKVKDMENLECERELLLKKITDCECCILQQRNEIQGLLNRIDCLTKDADCRQDVVRTKIVKMRFELQKKDELIQKSEEVLADVQNQLRKSIDGLTCETTCLKKRLEELDKERIKYHTQAKQCKEELNKTKQELEEKNKLLKQYKQKNEQLEKDLRKLPNTSPNGGTFGDEHFRRVLGQTNCALACLIDKMRRYGFGDGSEQLLTNELMARIEELEKQLAEARQLQNMDERMNSLLEELRLCKEENTALKGTNAVIQQLAKDEVNQLEGELQQTRRLSQLSIVEKDQLIGELNRELRDLKAQLEQCQQNNNDSDSVQQNNQRDNDFENMQQLIRNLEQQLEDCQNTSSDPNPEILRLTNLVSDLQRQLADCQNQTQSTDEEMRRLNNLINDQSRTALTNDEINNLTQMEQQLKDCQDAIKLANDENAKLTNLIDNLKQQLDDCRNSNQSNQLNDEMANMKRLIDNLKQQLADCQNSVRSGPTNNVELTEQNEELLAEIGPQQLQGNLTDEKQDDAERDNEEPETVTEIPTEEQEVQQQQAEIGPQEPEIPSNNLEDQSATPEPQPDASATPEVQPETSATPEVQPETSATPEVQPETSQTPERQPETSATPEVQPETSQTPEVQPETSATPEVQPETSERQPEQPRVQPTQPETQPERAEIQSRQQPKTGALGKEAVKPDVSKTQPKKQEKASREETKGKTPVQPSKKEEVQPEKLATGQKGGVSKPDKQQTVGKKNECGCSPLPKLIPISLPTSEISIQFRQTMPTSPTTPCRPTCLANFNFGNELQPPPTCTPYRGPNRQNGAQVISEKSVTLDMIPLTPQYPSCTLRITGRNTIERVPQIYQTGGTELIQKIADAENKLLSKQRRAKAKVNELQTKVMIYKKELDFEKQRNHELNNRSADQSKTIANMFIKMLSVKQQIVQEKRKNYELDSALKMLERNLQKEKRVRLGSECTPRGLAIDQSPHIRTPIQLTPFSARSCKCSARSSIPCDYNRYEIDD